MSNYKEGNDNDNNRELHQQYDRAKHNLAKALQNQSAEHRARVAEFVIDWQIDPNEEFFLIFAAIGHLKVLLEDAPQRLEGAYQPLFVELDQWMNLFSQQMKTYREEAEIINNLAQGCNRLGTTSAALDLTTKQQLEQLQSFTRLLTDLKQVAVEVSSLRREMGVINTLKQGQDSLGAKMERMMVAKSNDAAGRWNVNSRGLTWLVTFLIVVNAFGCAVFTKVFLWNTSRLVDYSYTKLVRIGQKLGTEPAPK